MSMNRREVISSLGMLGASALVGGAGLGAPKRTRSIRIAHLTDIHLWDRNNAPKKFEKCLHALQSISDAPDIIFNGGDTIFDALGADKSSVERQWSLWNSIIKEENNLPIVHCIGNHDVWGAGEKTDILYGKGYAVDKMELNRPYYSLEKAGWKFIILDSTHPVGDGWYTGKLDDEQFDWLENELAQTDSNTPIMVMSHIPILTATGFYEGNEKNGNWEVPGSWMHIDFNRIKKLFLKHPNVKLCISGHMHLLDNVQYNGVTYCCNGAVSGNWWGNELYHETKAGFALIDLYDDGGFNVEYRNYYW